MSRNLFGTDGVRGLVGEYPLDDIGLRAMGRAVGTAYAQEGETIVIACDTRQSSEHLVATLSSGLQEVGVNVVFAGVIPTPGLAYITTQHNEFVAGVMITASHNPAEYNGVKIFDRNGNKLPDESEAYVNDLMDNGAPDRGAGTYEVMSLSDEYSNFLIHSSGDVRFHDLTIALDLANGAASALGEQLFRSLGATCITIGNQPDGTNINRHCGATDLAALQSLVTNQHCDLGIAVDGDADRLIMVDGKGRICDGDHLLYVLAVHNEFRKVVGTVMTNFGVEQALRQHGISLERTAVGDRYVLEKLIETHGSLGAEQSGHIILTRLTTTGDGLLAAIQVLRALSESGRSLAEWRDDMKLLPQALVNFHIDDKAKLSLPKVTSFIKQQANLLGDESRLLIRPSGTEPLARVMVEGAQAEAHATEIAKKLQELVS